MFSFNHQLIFNKHTIKDLASFYKSCLKLNYDMQNHLPRPIANNLTNTL